MLDIEWGCCCGLKLLTMRDLYRAGPAGRRCADRNDVFGPRLVFSLHEILHDLGYRTSGGWSIFSGSIVAIIDNPPPPRHLVERRVTAALFASLYPGLLGPDEVNQVDARLKILVSRGVLIVGRVRHVSSGFQPFISRAFSLLICFPTSALDIPPILLLFTGGPCAQWLCKERRMSMRA